MRQEIMLGRHALCYSLIDRMINNVCIIILLGGVTWMSDWTMLYPLLSQCFTIHSKKRHFVPERYYY